MLEQFYIDKILNEIDTETIVSQHVKLSRKGRRLWACCPFHNEATPSFHIDTTNNLWYCHGCHRGGNVINFVMEHEHMDFNAASKKLLKEQLSIDLDEKEITPEEQERYKKVESMRIINKLLTEFFEAQLANGSNEAEAARKYMLSRWPEEYCQESHLGYAPKDAHAVEQWARSKGLFIELMKEMGILIDGQYGTFCLYRDRLMIPIRDRYSHVIGFTARTMSTEDAGTHKYINSSDCAIYHKKESIFGIDAALRKAHKENKMYLVEGGPDVMKLQSVGIANTIASLGGSWSIEQFRKLKDYRLQSATLCFVPDSDVPKDGQALGAGFLNVMAAGEMAMQCGFSVSVREIPNDLQAEQPKKIDPDLYINKVSDLQQLEEKEFVVWYLEKNLPQSVTIEEKQQLVAKVATLLTNIGDASVLDTYLDQLSKIHGKKTLWKNAMADAKKRHQAELVKKLPNHEKAMGMMEEFGFYQEGNCYYGASKDADKVRWSNFCLRPLFHIKDDIRPLRLFEIKNSDPDSQSELIELDMDALTAVRSFRKKLLGTGNYDWKMGEDELKKLTAYLAKDTPSAKQIKQMGHQREGFYAFSNGVLDEETLEWIPIDEMGIVKVSAGTYYLPALSQIYRDSTELYVNERKFYCEAVHPLTQSQYFEKVIGVFGNNAKISLCFYVGSLFADVIRASNVRIPILNLFGPISTGKSMHATALMCLFYKNPRPVAAGDTSLPALAEAVASVSNALVHIDEYANSLPLQKIEFFKNLWDAVGRVRINMDLDKKREQAHVDSAVILTGQEIPAIDPALYSRLVHLVHEKSTFTSEEKERFDDLTDVCENGPTYITLQLLKHREEFIAKWGDAYKKASMDMSHGIRNEENIVDRIRKNWTVIMAVYLASEDFVEYPYDYSDLLDLCVEGVKHQNKMSSAVDEVARFWHFISAAFQTGKIRKDEAFKISSKERIRLVSSGEIKFEGGRSVLMIRKEYMMVTYAQMGRSVEEKVLPMESMVRYLQLSDEYIGIIATPERFCKFIDGFPAMESGRKLYSQDRPLCFDYKRVCDRYGITFDTVVGDEYDGF